MLERIKGLPHKIIAQTLLEVCKIGLKKKVLVFKMNKGWKYIKDNTVELISYNFWNRVNKSHKLDHKSGKGIKKIEEGDKGSSNSKVWEKEILYSEMILSQDNRFQQKANMNKLETAKWKFRKMTLIQLGTACHKSLYQGWTETPGHFWQASLRPSFKIKI